MPSLKCPYCENAFEVEDTTVHEQDRVECPLCGKMCRLVQRKTGDEKRLNAEAKSTTGWGTEGFESARRRAEYGEIKPGDVLGGFRIEKMIGAGAMAVVYEATQLSLDRRVALKVLPTEFAQRETFVRQFDSETGVLAALNHPNIVSIIDRGREEDTYYFAMEYVEGTTLGELLSASEVDEEFLLQMVEQCAEALVYAHSNGIIHRDLKPANIMLNEQGIVKIADFGVAGLLAEARAEGEGKRRVMGTRGYMPPEQELHINRCDERSDIFSLGAVMYRVLTGKVPDRLPPAPPSEVAPEVDPRLDSLVLKCLQASPAHRYQSAEEFLEAVQACRRAVSGAQVVCPNCQKGNPVTQKTCLHCGEDLSELFDLCPECGAENRIDVEVCMECGRSLKQLRHQMAVQISQTEERARALAGRNRYGKAIEQLQKVLAVKGKLFQRAREKARRLIESYREERREHYADQVSEARDLTDQGKLQEALQKLEAVPEDLAPEHRVPELIDSVRSRMSIAKKRVGGIDKLLSQRRFEQAQQALQKVEGMWASCPGLEEARKKVEAGLQTEEMIDFELQRARQRLEEGDYAGAREAVEFARSAASEAPEVKKLLEQIEEREQTDKLRSSLAAGKKAYGEGRFRDATVLLREALEMLPEDHERRPEIERLAESAREEARGGEIVELERAGVVPLQEVGVLGGKKATRGILTTLLVLAGAAVVITGGLLLVLGVTG